MIIIQFTGLSGVGKTTIANEVAKKLEFHNIKVEILDGDMYRKSLCKDLKFSKRDRNENIRRMGFVASILIKHNIISIIAAINPYELVRQELIKQYCNVITIWIKCELSELKKRDTKNLYKKALLPLNHQNKITNLTGINDPYEPPNNPDLVIDTTNETIQRSVEKLYAFLMDIDCIKNFLKAK